MDAILSLGVTQLVDRILQNKQVSHPAAADVRPLKVEALDRAQARDVLLLAACYDQSTAHSGLDRWKRLRRRLRFRTWTEKWDIGLGLIVTVATIALIGAMGWWRFLLGPWPYAVMLAGWLPRLWRIVRAVWRARKIVRHTHVLNHATKQLSKILLQFAERQLVGQPLPAAQRTDDRYELLAKLQNVLTSLELSGIVVLVDRVDEPYLINGSNELMRALLWPMLDNKLLKHPGIGFKLLLPTELTYFLDREDHDFHQRARLDKQNLIRSLQWTGQSLYDLTNARVKACAVEGRSPTMGDLLDDSIDERRLLDTMQSLRTPRHLFKFFYRLLVAHTNAYTDENPVWKISAETFESTFALYQRDQDAQDRGAGAGG